MSLKNIEYCFERAAECEHLASQAFDAKNRETLLFVASRWKVLAADEQGYSAWLLKAKNWNGDYFGPPVESEDTIP